MRGTSLITLRCRWPKGLGEAMGIVGSTSPGVGGRVTGTGAKLTLEDITRLIRRTENSMPTFGELEQAAISRYESGDIEGAKRLKKQALAQQQHELVAGQAITAFENGDVDSAKELKATSSGHSLHPMRNLRLPT